MSRSLDDANREIVRVRDMPYGAARTQAAEQQVRLVEAEGPDGARAFALLVLIESLVWNGEVERAYLPFTKAVRWYDEHPEHFDESDAHGLFWSFKWMVGHLSDFPNVPAAQIEATLEDMERRYLLAGLGRDAVARERFAWARSRGTADADALYDEWVRTPRDEYSQCEACDPGDRASYLIGRGDVDAGIRLIEQTLDAGVTCATEPADMLATLALAHLEAGRAEAAVSAHRRAIAALAGAESDMAGARGQRFELLARGGQPVRALRALTADAHLLLVADTPGDRYYFLRYVVAGTAALLPAHAEAPVALDGVPATDVASLHAWAVAQAAELAAAFDARNGTDQFARGLAEARATRPADVTLDLAVIRPDAIPAPDASEHAGGARADDVRAHDVREHDVREHDVRARDAGGTGASGAGEAAVAETLAARAERLVSSGDLVAAAAAWLETAAQAAAEGRLADSGIATAEAARCAQEVGDEDGAAAAYPGAVARMRAGGLPPQDIVPVVVAWAPIAVATGTTAAVLAAADGLLEDLTDVPASGAPRADDPGQAGAGSGAGADASAQAAGAELAGRVAAARARARADLDDTAARVLASSGPDHAAQAAHRAARAAESYAGAGAVADAAHAFWLAGRLHDSLGNVDDALWNLESAVEGFGIARQRNQRTEAASSLVATLRAAGRDDRAEEILRTLTT
ncbi:hypothetical protein [Cellulomonas gelida]|uniref:Tetratricopeptide repeat protein n=1 Tax=Cellulomonas gelida TaxID=1712 RepID=A0A4Y3KS88_9CELL|nr:hypothetical protein [Cellulomonas gelida]GEA85800.1 hypothetical protein CGE01nite_30510 [Cellulomonas gelida]GGL33215.1 hypothetical protein GCM10009774_24610 [Cellulomonas gelida]